MLPFQTISTSLSEYIDTKMQGIAQDLTQGVSVHMTYYWATLNLQALN